MNTNKNFKKKKPKLRSSRKGQKWKKKKTKVKSNQNKTTFFAKINSNQNTISKPTM